MMLKYRCVNENCSQENEVVEIPPGRSAECHECGWFMEAVG